MAWWTKYTEVEVELAIANALAGGVGGADISGTSNTQVLFNDNGTIGGDANLTWISASKELNIGLRPPNVGQSLVGIFDDGFAYMQMATAGNTNSEIDVYSFGGTLASPAPTADGDAMFSLSVVGFTNTMVSRVASEWLTYAKSVDDTHIVGHMQFDVARPDTTANGQTQLILQGTGYSHIGPLAGSTAFQTFWTDSTLTIDDVTGSGITTHIIRAGPNQSTTDLTQWRIADIDTPAVLARVLSDGAIQTSAYFAGVEVAEPAAPAANGYRIFAKDTGGKTQLMVRFNSGASQPLAIEP